MLSQNDQKIREMQLEAIAEKLGKDAADAMRDYLSIITDGFYIWLAGLYDPETGALYYSNSARDNERARDGDYECLLLPDLESTPRGYGWLATAGMLGKYNGSLAAAFPEWLKEKLIKWTQGLQSTEDGFFYHPQWGKDIHPARRARDLDCAVTFLERLGGDLLYDTPTGHHGVLGAPSAATVVTDGGTVSALPDHLTSTKKFLVYLDSYDWEHRSYQTGHLFESQAYQIKNAGPEFVRSYAEYVGAKQEQVQAKRRAEGKPANGLWETGLRYDAINGLMKICSTYTRLGLKLNYIEEAFESALEMLTLTTPDADGRTACYVVDVYNPWVALNVLIANVREFGDTETAAKLRARLVSRAAELISVTREKLSIFQKKDGSYGYCAVGVPHRSQNALVAVAGTDEGDVNGGTIATASIITQMCAALGVDMPNLYFDSDFEVFMSIIEKKNREYESKKG